jgi:ubiquinone biosynthesis accessory factor UbiJ
MKQGRQQGNDAPEGSHSGPDPLLPFRPLEALLNRGIRASTDATRRCRELEGTRFRIELDGLGLGFTLRSSGEAVLLVAGTEADARLAGTPLSLARLAATGDERLLRSKAVRISGDPLVARDFRELIALAAPDFEEELARLVGDVAARQVGNLARHLAGWGLDAADRLSRSLAEYLQEESRELPARAELEAFLDAVDELAAAADRLEARLGQLEGRG